MAQKVRMKDGGSLVAVIADEVRQVDVLAFSWLLQVVLKFIDVTIMDNLMCESRTLLLASFWLVLEALSVERTKTSCLLALVRTLQPRNRPIRHRRLWHSYINRRM